MMTKTKILTVLYEVALSKAEQLKLATKRSKIQFHSSHASGSGDGVDTKSKIPDEKKQKVTSTNEGASVRPKVPNVPKDDSESEEESWTFSQDDGNANEETYINDDSEETKSNNDIDDFTHPSLSTYKTDDQEEEEGKEDDEEVSALETKMSKFKQTNQFAEAVSSILGIVDNYLASKMKEAVDVAVQLTLVESYNSNKDIISSYGDVVTLKRGRDDQDKDEDIFAGSNRGSKRRRSGKETKSSKEPKHKESKSTSYSKSASRSQQKSLGKSDHAEEYVQKVDDLEDQPHQEFNTRTNDVTPAREARDDDEHQWNRSSSPTPDREWHKTKTVDNRHP
nr:hypothetical protein [Tanacetum cinerariifolium]